MTAGLPNILITGIYSKLSVRDYVVADLRVSQDHCATGYQKPEIFLRANVFGFGTKILIYAVNV
jgi:hypothetical protein